MYFLVACGIITGSTAPNNCKLMGETLRGVNRAQCVTMQKQAIADLKRVSPNTPYHNYYQCIWANAVQVDGLVLQLPDPNEPGE